MEGCDICGSHIETRWATCPACGDSDSNLASANLSIVNLVENSEYLEFHRKKQKKSKKKVKSECCEKYKRRNKSACKRCPLSETIRTENQINIFRQV
tara:strand:+ start:1397 stop:1687 length:291 start_codon:yes stop_codon:yes gene_type:complete